MISNVKSRLKRLGKVGTTFLVLLPIYLILLLLAPSSGFATFLQLILSVLGAWLAIRFGRIGMRKAIWRLRNRILVTYLFIAVVPVLLILTLVVGTLTLGTGRTTILQGAVHLSLFAAYLFLSFAP